MLHAHTGSTLALLVVHTRLLYNHARLYDPELARFVSADSVVVYVSSPQDLNRYSYGLNTPVKNIDPTGHCATGLIVDTAVCVIVVVSESAALAGGATLFVVGTAASYAAAGGGTAYTTDAAGAIVPITSDDPYAPKTSDDLPIKRQKQDEHVEGTPNNKNRVKTDGPVSTYPDRETAENTLVRPGILGQILMPINMIELENVISVKIFLEPSYPTDPRLLE